VKFHHVFLLPHISSNEKKEAALGRNIMIVSEITSYVDFLFPFFIALFLHSSECERIFSPRHEDENPLQNALSSLAEKILSHAQEKRKKISGSRMSCADSLICYRTQTLRGVERKP
jgi:hypothetical protein